MSSRSYEEVLFDTISKFGILFDNVPSEQRVLAYVDHLKKYCPEKISKALSELKYEAHKFPSLASIVQKIEPSMTENDRANEVVNAIMEALPRFGSEQAKDAREYLGPHAWHVIEGLGGWSTLCKTGYSELGTMRAQMREMAKSTYKILKRDPSKELLTHEKTNSQRLSGAISENKNNLLT